jgi:hypothetical protein
MSANAFRLSAKLPVALGGTAAPLDTGSFTEVGSVTNLIHNDSTNSLGHAERRKKRLSIWLAVALLGEMWHDV